jgi:hypothetical protein
MALALLPTRRVEEFFFEPPTASFAVRTSFWPSRSMLEAISLLVRAFCAASAFAASVPRVDPMDSAKFTSTESALVRLRELVAMGLDSFQ